MPILIEQSVGQLVAENPERARVFEKYRIDYCCGGKLTLSDACGRKGADVVMVAEELAALDSAPSQVGTDWTSAPLAELADHIVATHHAHLETELPRLSILAQRVAKVHGEYAPETVKLQAVFEVFKAEMTDHAMKEESILFPWIKRLEQGGAAPMLASATVASPIHCMEQEHEHAGAALEEMRHLTNAFRPPMGACNTWRVLYASLEALEHDMHVHVHKENSILFPRAIALEGMR
jgi:regulator of cell morphogenesis and NO signaling